MLVRIELPVCPQMEVNFNWFLKPSYQKHIECSVCVVWTTIMMCLCAFVELESSGPH